MTIYDELVYGFFLGAGFKLIDDIFDMYKKENINKYILELLKFILIILLGKSLEYNNYFCKLLIFNSMLGFVFLPDAYTTEPCWAVVSILSLLYTTFYFIFNFNSKPLKLFLLYNVIYYVQWTSTHITEFCHCFKPLKKYLPSLYPYLFLEEDVEISIQKLIFRLLNALFCIYMLLFGNKQIINYFNIQDNDFITILPITSWFIFGYMFVSVINQSYYIFVKKITYQKVDKQINSFFGIEFKEDADAEKEDVNVEVKKEADKEDVNVEVKEEAEINSHQSSASPLMLDKSGL